MSTTPALNQGQEAAYNKILGFLFSNELECSLSGPAGTGKTHMMLKVVTDLLEEYKVGCGLSGTTPVPYNVHFTATTHKAAGALSQAAGRQVSTIHSFLGMRIINNYDTGKKETIGPSPPEPFWNGLIFVDEASMLSADIKGILVEQARDYKAKIIYIGDGIQLNPIDEKQSPVYSQVNTFDHELTQPMRNRNSQGLIELCAQLRETVKGGPFLPIQLIPGSIDYLDDAHGYAWLENAYRLQAPDLKILTYTNERAIQYNQLIRQIRGYPDDFFSGENVVCNNRVNLSKKNFIYPDEEMVINHIDPEIQTHFFDDYELQYRRITVARKLNAAAVLNVPVNYGQVAPLKKHFRKRKQWDFLFTLDDNFADLRPGSASTTHKSQGSTYDVVLVDLSDFHKARDRDTLARLLYVGVSRAKSRVLFAGALPSHLFAANTPQFYLPAQKEHAHV